MYLVICSAERIAWLWNCKSGSFTKEKKSKYTQILSRITLELCRNGMHQNSTSQTIHSLFLGAWYFMQSPDPSCKSHTVIELPENRKSVPWKMISYQKCLTVFLIFVLQLAGAAVFPFYGYFQLINSFILAEVLALGPERQTCLLAIAFWYLKCHSLDLSFLPHPASKSFPWIGPIHFQSPATPSYFLSQPMKIEN